MWVQCWDKANKRCHILLPPLKQYKPGHELPLAPRAAGLQCGCGTRKNSLTRDVIFTCNRKQETKPIFLAISANFSSHIPHWALWPSFSEAEWLEKLFQVWQNYLHTQKARDLPKNIFLKFSLERWLSFSWLVILGYLSRGLFRSVYQLSPANPSSLTRKPLLHDL